jgi:hypothetical protein
VTDPYTRLAAALQFLSAEQVAKLPDTAEERIEACFLYALGQSSDELAHPYGRGSQVSRRSRLPNHLGRDSPRLWVVKGAAK